MPTFTYAHATFTVNFCETLWLHIILKMQHTEEEGTFHLDYQQYIRKTASYITQHGVETEL